MKGIRKTIFVSGVFVLILCTSCTTKKEEIKKEHRGIQVENVYNNCIKPDENRKIRKIHPKGEKNCMQITMIGDSILLGASEELLLSMPECIIDAKKSRQVEEGIESIRKLKEQGQLGDVVVIALGTNGTFSDEAADEILSQIGRERRVCWVTAYGTNLSWKDEVNEQIKSLEKEYNVVILDWEKLAAGHAEWFCEDGIHLNEQGKREYA